MANEKKFLKGIKNEAEFDWFTNNFCGNGNHNGRLQKIGAGGS